MCAKLCFLHELTYAVSEVIARDEYWSYYELEVEKLPLHCVFDTTLGIGCLPLVR